MTKFVSSLSVLVISTHLFHSSCSVDVLFTLKGNPVIVTQAPSVSVWYQLNLWINHRPSSLHLHLHYLPLKREDSKMVKPLGKEWLFILNETKKHFIHKWRGENAGYGQDKEI